MHPLKFSWHTFGRNDNNASSRQIRIASKNFIKAFKEKRKSTCCRVLSSGFETDEARHENCANIVGECAEILENIVKENLVSEKQNKN
ncbi:MAG: C-GCAxxG-C-C family protein [Ignavibacteriales bacterium]|nr:C-GCAxxG-C-C family protein [Ignavibacteriales bacterium]